MTRWTRRRTILDEFDTPRDDWLIARDGVDVGRTYWRINGRGHSQWFWASWIYPPSSGVAATLEEALEAVRRTGQRDE